MTEASASNSNPAVPPWRNLDLNLSKAFPLTLENALVVLLIILAVVTRLYGLGDRVASHDEVNHFVPSYSFSQGEQFRFDPMTHGPLQMHLIALSFVMLGDNDFTARLPAALFSIATVAIALLLFRRYLGRTGALIAGVLFLISPYMLYYGRYQRNEAFIVVWSILTLYAVLRYLERGEWKILVLFTAVFALHFTDKATAYIYAGGSVIFLAGLFLIRLARRPDVARLAKIRFFVSLLVGGGILAFAAFLWQRGSPAYGQSGDALVFLPAIVMAIFGLAALITGAVLLWQEAGEKIRAERSFDLIVLLGTLVLPLTSAAWMDTLGKLFGTTQPAQMDFSFASSLGVLFDSQYGPLVAEALLYILPLAAISIVIGLWWRPRQWPTLALIFFGIFAFFFTTVFTTAGGFFDGLVRYLGYWIVQHGESRGSQPWYYYLFVQIPIYEYLPAVGAVLAFFVALRRRLWTAVAGKPYERPEPPADADGTAPAAAEGDVRPVPTIALFLYWALFSLAIFSYAGEKMPQQTMLISAPMILAAAWTLGYLIDTVSKGELFRFRNWKFEVPARVTRTARSFLLAAFGLMGILTARTAYFAAFINYNYPNEYMAYAHAGPGPKIALAEIDRLSYLTTGGTDMIVAYDNFVRYPYWWYLRHYRNRIDFDVNPTAEIRQAAIVLVGDQNNAKVESILDGDYVSFEQVRMWWHNQDYFGLKWDYLKTDYLNEARDRGVDDPPPMSTGDYLRLVWDKVSPIFTDPPTRAAAFQIWLNRDFTEWGDLFGPGYTMQDWSLEEGMRIYIRKDVVEFLGGSPDHSGGGALAYDPYELSRVDLVPDFWIGRTGSEGGQFAAPRGIAAAPDGSLYVADSLNDRIQHLDADGNLIAQWGSYGSVDQGGAPGGTFNEPWGVGVGPDGSVYVADTWNHRIQKFTADGAFVAMWGEPIGGAPGGGATLYGPRAVAVDAQGRVFVTDTGNKRVLVFSSDGELLTQFGSPGAAEGQLDEPVGLAIDDQGFAYVADTWNRRVSIFAPAPDGSFEFYTLWDVNAWFGTTAEIKPYLAVDANHHVFLTDPSTCRLLEFTQRGVILNVWGKCGEDDYSLNSPTGLAVDPLGGIWVSDSRHDRLVHYPLPESAGNFLQAP
jgi:predicted membrane-bound mannosyltransferase/DNA-binding beta-propeller fold protein YncE